MEARMRSDPQYVLLHLQINLNPSSTSHISSHTDHSSFQGHNTSLYQHISSGGRFGWREHSREQKERLKSHNLISGFQKPVCLVASAARYHKVGFFSIVLKLLRQFKLFK